ncbi:protein LONGIFOLIA 1 isoform X1 [Ricinus communis]|uniref:protein LONGIFOLIA 1 isoform X1 n=1 Tax=Ricinus communis TaxID=3988 RepID=UPI0007725D3A|nr:protein LONGIFOLIA 1 isoform X1 [Ricinus communis]|eukprot:XP_015579923.1 protein LONGIFOLIA 1 isoform X1 [Ricinus communis]
MSAKFVHTLSDENPDLQKQIGCMNGIFQLFERHHFLSGRRQITGHNQKRLPSGQNGNYNIEPKNASQKTDKDHKKAVKEKQRISTESSRTSFSSSSCSSSLSSLECNNRASQLEPCLFNQTTVTETHGRDSSLHQLNASFRSSQQSPDLRDVVKDSIYREARGLSVKTATKGESGGQTLKYFDSPRPVQHPNFLNPKVSGLKESFQALHKLRESPWKSSEGRRASSTSALKDARRFSCDGRESRDASKSTVKLKELPRLSLDSRAGSVRGSSTGMKSNDLLEDLERRDRNSNNFLSQQEEPESRTRLSNVVAKLMGLEALPDSMLVNENQTRHIKTNPDVENHHFLGSPRTTEYKQNQISGSPRNLQKKPISPRMGIADSIKKPIPNSKFPLEPAPWRHPDGSRTQTPVPKSRVTQPKAPNTSLSVYGEIEKRLAQLEFKESGKDLRALKQILEAMQKTKELLETKHEAPNSVIQKSNNSSLHSNSKSSSLCNSRSNSPISALTRETSSPDSFKSPIVIMRPAKFMQRAHDPASSVQPSERFTVLHGVLTADSAESRKESIEKQSAKDLTPRTSHLREQYNPPSRPMDKSTATRFARFSQASKEPQSTARGSTNSGRSSANLNLRQPQKFELEKRTTQSNSMRTRRQPSRQPTESGSPRRKPRSRSSNLQPNNDELSDAGSDMRNLIHHGDAISQQSDSTISLASQVDEEVSSTDRSYKITHQKHKKPVASSMKDGTVAEPAVASEQPSPVSVLDATFYADDLPSPIKKKSIAFKEDEVEWNQVDIDHSSSNTDSSLNSTITHKKVENIHLLIHKLTRNLSAHEGPFISEIPNLYNSKNPDHQYISEILLASGLLKDFGSGFITNHLRQTSYPINPTLFLSLEQSKASTMFSNDKKNRTKISKSELQNELHRKLVFDAVNEILIHRLLLESSPKHGLSSNMLADKRPWGQQLWGELCSEVDRLQNNGANCSLDDEDSLTSVLRADLMHRSKNWSTCNSEIPGLVLDIERLIFKDLISELITGEALGLQVQLAGHCGQLCST